MNVIRQNSLFAVSRRPKSIRRGVTLVDLTLSTMILGIMAAVAIPKLTSAISFYQVDSAARRIEADLNYIRGQARYSNVPCSITFVASPPSFTTTGVPHINNSGAAYAIDYLKIGYTINLTANFNATGSVTYSEAGIPTAGSPLSTLSSGSITITNGSLSRTVTVDPVSGKARRS